MVPLKHTSTLGHTSALIVIFILAGCVRIAHESPDDSSRRCDTNTPQRDSTPSGDRREILDRTSRPDQVNIDQKLVDTSGAGADGQDPPQPALPSGMIVMWSGPLGDIPAGWALCDGAQGTPDLTSRFILSVAAAEDPGPSGGSSSHTHAMSPHTHAVNPPPTSTTSHTSTLSVTNDTTHTIKECTPAHFHVVDIEPFSSAGATISGAAAQHLPPYFKLAFIMKL